MSRYQRGMYLGMSLGIGGGTAFAELGYTQVVVFMQLLLVVTIWVDIFLSRRARLPF